MDDHDLLTAVAGGNDLALRTLFERHAGWLAARLRTKLPAHAVEDVLQETFLAIWRGAGTYEGTGQVGGWMWGIAVRQVALWARKHNRPLPDLELHGTEDVTTQSVLRIDLQRAFAGLDTDHGDLARMVLIEDRSTADAAQRMGIPEGTVKSRMHRIRRLLRAALEGGSS